jgi:Protein of unknown function (DUF2934)
MNNNTFEIPMHEQIERRAYQIYLEHGFNPGNALEDWLAAEEELTEASEKKNMTRPRVDGESRRAATA